jgi:hypothetical protein
VVLGEWFPVRGRWNQQERFKDGVGLIINWRRVCLIFNPGGVPGLEHQKFIVVLGTERDLVGDGLGVERFLARWGVAQDIVELDLDLQ